jgi:hypothetical protein
MYASMGWDGTRKWVHRRPRLPGRTLVARGRRQGLSRTRAPGHPGLSGGRRVLGAGDDDAGSSELIPGGRQAMATGAASHTHCIAQPQAHLSATCAPIPPFDTHHGDVAAAGRGPGAPARGRARRGPPADAAHAPLPRDAWQADGRAQVQVPRRACPSGPAPAR